MVDQPYELQFGGPGIPPQPWYAVAGVAIAYDGAILSPGNVPGGPQGAGTINVNDLYIQGVRLENLIQGFLPLTGGTLTGPLIISGPNNLQIGLGTSGQVLASDGSGNTYWTSSAPGGPYLAIAGGQLTGNLTLPDNTHLLMGGGSQGQVLQTDGNSNLSWVNPGGAGSLPPAGTAGYLLATDGVETPYWTNVLPGGPYAPAVTGGYLPLSGGTLTGALLLAGDPTAALQAVTKEYSDQNVLAAGDTMTGPLILSGDPTAALGAVTKEYVDNKYLGDNMIINGDFYVDQRNNGASGTAAGYMMDRWVWSNTVASKITWQRTTWSPTGLGANGFIYSIYLNTTTAYATLAAGDYFCFYQGIEADLITRLFWGTQTSGYPATLSFYVYTTQLGIYSGSVRNAAGNRSFVFSYTVSAVGWQKVIINVPPDTNAGSWILSGNAVALTVTFCLGVGTTYSTGIINTWQSGNYLGSTNQINFVGISNAQFYLTGVKFELGNIATPFKLETLSKKISDCQRYYQTLTAVLASGYAAAGGFVYATLPLPTRMRAIPTVAVVGAGYGNASALVTNNIYADNVSMRATITAAGNGYGQGTLQLSAEF